MDIIIGILVDLFFDGGLEAGKSKKVPKPIRYFIYFLILLFFISVIGLIIWIGINTLKDSLIGGILIILFAIVLSILSIYYIKKPKNKKSKKK